MINRTLGAVAFVTCLLPLTMASAAFGEAASDAQPHMGESTKARPGPAYHCSRGGTKNSEPTRSACVKAGGVWMQTPDATTVKSTTPAATKAMKPDPGKPTDVDAPSVPGE